MATGEERVDEVGPLRENCRPPPSGVCRRHALAQCRDAGRAGGVAQVVPGEEAPSRPGWRVRSCASSCKASSRATKVWDRAGEPERSERNISNFPLSRARRRYNVHRAMRHEARAGARLHSTPLAAGRRTSRWFCTIRVAAACRRQRGRLRRCGRRRGPGSGTRRARRRVAEVAQGRAAERDRLARVSRSAVASEAPQRGWLRRLDRARIDAGGEQRLAGIDVACANDHLAVASRDWFDACPRRRSASAVKAPKLRVERLPTQPGEQRRSWRAVESRRPQHHAGSAGRSGAGAARGDEVENDRGPWRRWQASPRGDPDIPRCISSPPRSSGSQRYLPRRDGPAHRLP